MLTSYKQKEVKEYILTLLLLEIITKVVGTGIEPVLHA